MQSWGRREPPLAATASFSRTLLACWASNLPCTRMHEGAVHVSPRQHAYRRALRCSGTMSQKAFSVSEGAAALLGDLSAGGRAPSTILAAGTQPADGIKRRRSISPPSSPADSSGASLWPSSTTGDNGGSLDVQRTEQRISAVIFGEKVGGDGLGRRR